MGPAGKPAGTGMDAVLPDLAGVAAAAQLGADVDLHAAQDTAVLGDADADLAALRGGKARIGAAGGLGLGKAHRATAAGRDRNRRHTENARHTAAHGQ